MSDGIGRGVLLLVLQAFMNITVCLASPCDLHSTHSNLTDRAACLEGILAAVQDKSLFWFGTDFAARCPPRLLYTFACVSFNTDTSARSLSTQVFTPGTLDVNKINTYVDVQYTSDTGTYTGCGNTYTMGSQKMRIDPLSSEAYTPWSLRQTPSVTWAAKNDKEYTLVVVDVGFFFIHGLYMNIQGNDISSAAIKPYHGPQTTRETPNVYAFLLFEQRAANITLLPQWRAALFSFGMTRFNITEFAKDQGLEGPVGINWVLATFDPYSVQAQSARGIENCAAFVEKALPQHSRPFLPANHSLSVFIDITFTAPAISFTYCCKTFEYSAKTFKLNPIGNGVIATAEGRGETTRMVELRKTGLYPNASVAFAGEYLTLLMVDPDVPISSVGTEELPLVHWLTMNIHDGNIEKGEEILSYRGPMPPDQLPHTYYYLLYRQPRMLTTNHTAQYAGDCSSRVAGRCLFNVTEFVADNNLQLIGVTWMIAQNDAYVNFTKIRDGQASSRFCQWTEGYADPCPASGATSLSFCERCNISYNNVRLYLVTLYFAWFIQLSS